MVLWWIGNALLAVVISLVLLLGNRVIRPATEISRYADDILEHGVGITKNLEPVPALIATRDLVSVAKGHAVRYVVALDPLV